MLRIVNDHILRSFAYVLEVYRSLMIWLMGLLLGLYVIGLLFIGEFN